MLYAVKPPSPSITNVRREGGRLILESELFLTVLEPKAPGIVRVTVTREKELSNMPRPGIVAMPAYDGGIQEGASAAYLKDCAAIRKADSVERISHPGSTREPARTECMQNDAGAPESLLAEIRPHKDWTYEETQDEIVLTAGRTVLRILRETGSFSWYDESGRLLLAEAEKDSKVLERFPKYRMVAGRTDGTIMRPGSIWRAAGGSLRPRRSTGSRCS